MNNTDRELLEWAAKAAGIDPKYIDGVEEANGPGYSTYWKYWRPLTDDGDALRLATKLGLFSREIIDIRLTESIWADDPHAAIRRAIVEIAAKIGKNIT
jgi:hypothetical protein